MQQCNAVSIQNGQNGQNGCTEEAPTWSRWEGGAGLDLSHIHTNKQTMPVNIGTRQGYPTVSTNKISKTKIDMLTVDNHLSYWKTNLPLSKSVQVQLAQL